MTSPLRTPMVVGNWKMHGSFDQVEIIINEFTTGMIDLQTSGKATADDFKNIEIVLCPPAVYLQRTQELIKGLPVRLGGQNAHDKKQGAYTGEISASMLYDSGCRYVILGHSERRQGFGETDSLIARKCVSAYDAGLIPIMCLGETADEREGGQTFEVVNRQLDALLSYASKEVMGALVLAYEPIWAIGTGATATPLQVEEVHGFLRARMKEYSPSLSDGLRILYGGSVKSQNAASLFTQPNVDGGLIGGASLNGREFLNICQTLVMSIRH